MVTFKLTGNDYFRLSMTRNVANERDQWVLCEEIAAC